MERKIKPRKCVGVERIPDDDFLYGSFKDGDALVDSTRLSDRVRAAKWGYGVDKLKDDKDFRVRAVVASQGFYINQLINDSSMVVRERALQFIKG